MPIRHQSGRSDISSDRGCTSPGSCPSTLEAPFESRRGPSNPSDSKESRSLRTDTQRIRSGLRRECHRSAFLGQHLSRERPLLPMIDVKLTKENALPYDLWGLISETWKPSPENDVTVFLQGLEKRGPDNRRKRIYMSAVTPDLYRPMYS